MHWWRGCLVRLLITAFAACIALLPGCAARSTSPRGANDPFLDVLERRTFQWFWDLSDPETGLTPDRWPTESFSTVTR